MNNQHYIRKYSIRHFLTINQLYGWYQLVCTAKTACIRINEGEPANNGPVPKAWAFLFAHFPDCRTRSEDSADRIGGKVETVRLKH
jgi:hypothetical protein